MKLLLPEDRQFHVVKNILADKFTLTPLLSEKTLKKQLSNGVVISVCTYVG